MSHVFLSLIVDDCAEEDMVNFDRIASNTTGASDPHLPDPNQSTKYQNGVSVVCVDPCSKT